MAEPTPESWSGVAGKRVVITGATNGIGLAAAEALAARGARLAIVARDPARAEAAVARVRAASGANSEVDVLMADLSTQAEVRRLAAEIRERYPRVDVLANNAGVILSRRQISADGFELTWAVNHLAPFLLTTLLLDRLRESAPARVITTSSAAHRGNRIPFDDLNAERGYASFRRYGESKLANILFTAELARQLQGSGVTANCFHPGFVATGFNGNNGAMMRTAMGALRPFQRSPARGADTLVWLADAPEVGDVTGCYFVDRQQRTPSPAAHDAEAAARLWAVSAEQAGPGASVRNPG